MFRFSSSQPDRRNKLRRHIIYGPGLTSTPCGKRSTPLKGSTWNVVEIYHWFPTLTLAQWSLVELKQPSRNMMIEKLNSWRPLYTLVTKPSCRWSRRPLPFCPTSARLVHAPHIRVRLETWAALIGRTILTLIPHPCMGQASERRHITRCMLSLSDFM